MEHRVETVTEFGQLVRRLREGGAWTLEHVAAAAGISKPYLSNIEHGRTPGTPRETKLRALESALHAQPGTLTGPAIYLKTPPSVRRLLRAQETMAPRRPDGSVDLDALVGEGVSSFRFPVSGTPEARKKTRPHHRSGNSKLETGNAIPLLHPVPIINKVPAGIAADFTHLDYPPGVADDYVPAPSAGAHPETGLAAGQFAVRVEGDSMLPLYLPGDIVVAADLPMRNGDDCVVRLGEGDDSVQTLKRVFILGGGDDGEMPTHLRLVPLNRATRSKPWNAKPSRGCSPSYGESHKCGEMSDTNLRDDPSEEENLPQMGHL